MLDVNNGGPENNNNNKGRVELFEKGYGKDAAGIAREAMAYGSYFFCGRLLPVFNIVVLVQARTNDFDVVLIDTAGRMQDNEVSDDFDFFIARRILLPKAVDAGSCQGEKANPVLFLVCQQFFHSWFPSLTSWFQPTILTRSFSLARHL